MADSRLSSSRSRSPPARNRRQNSIDPNNLPRLFDFGALSLDVIEEATTIKMNVDYVTSKTQDEIDTWPTPPPPEYLGAILLIGSYVHSEIQWDPKSDHVLARIVGLFAKNVLRQHSDMTVHQKQGAWQRISILPEDVHTGAEGALNKARYLLLQMMLNKVSRNWAEVFAFIKDFTEWNVNDFVPVESFEFVDDHWTGTLAATFDQIPWRLSKAGQSNDGLDCFARWFQSPMPSLLPILAFPDVKLRYRPDGTPGQLIEQVPKDDDNDCYQFINVELHWKPPDHEALRFFIQ